MNITGAELAMLRARQKVPRPAPEAEWLPGRRGVRLFVPGALRNPLNRKPGWQDERRYRQRWKEGVANALLSLGYRRGALGSPALRKHVVFTAHVYHRFDSQDNLRACLKAAVDGLVECELLDDDRDSAGHLFEYHQVVDRARPGVEIEVRVAP